MSTQDHSIFKGLRPRAPKIKGMLCPRTTLIRRVRGASPQKKVILTCSARRLEEELGEKMCVVEFDAEFMID